MGVVVNLPVLRLRAGPRDWSTQELAEFYRVESALLQAGLAVTTDRGLSDEGGPWFVFCRRDDEEVISHFARINHEYVIVSPAFSGSARGSDFRKLVNELLDRQPLVLPLQRQRDQKLLLHPASFLIALIAAAYVYSPDKGGPIHDESTEVSEKHPWLSSLARQEFVFVSAVAIAVSWIESHVDHLLDVAKDISQFHLDVAATGDANPSPSFAHDWAAVDSTADALFDFGWTAHKLADVAARSQITIPNEGDGGHLVQGPTVVAGNFSFGLISTLRDGKTFSTADEVRGSEKFLLDHDQVDHGDVMLPNFDASVLSEGWQAFFPKVPAPSNLVTSPAASMANLAAQSVPADSSVSNDAFQFVASKLSLPELQPIVLSTGPASLDAAVHQALMQVGMDSSELRIGTIGQISNSSGQISNNNISQPSELVVPTNQIPPSPAAGSNLALQVVQAVQDFLQHTPAYDVTVSGQNVVIVDTNVADARSSDFGVRTWEMSDGSTLSVVGIISHVHSVALA